ncbi:MULTISPECIES: aspartate aminotransferase family protein [unclassified Streptomyces]|uniref:aspartate aminotransferase family protein n=1 Tax=unclassified Streptomyces TaxID=2593676 RepID=UPI002E2E52AF|nr:aminotransferase class III-fold pyridoxal phosphate-dependent enzyme [Streptomyces sp. NBC_00223]
MIPLEAPADAPDYVARAERVLPGGASGSWRSYDMQVVRRTSGAHIWTADGTRYIDHILAWGTVVIGHSDHRVNRAVFAAAEQCDLTTLGPQQGEVEVAERICSVMPSAQNVAFCVSGTEATLHAVQLARAATGRTKLLKFHGSYHGWHDMLAVGVRAAPGREDRTDLRATESVGIHPAAAADVVVVEWNDAAGLAEAFAAHGPELAAAFCEPYVQSYGCTPAEPGFLEQLRELCTASGTLLVFDEVKTAFRHHLGGYQAICGVIPDITTFSKALGNGYSVGGLAGRRDLMAGFQAGHARGAVMDGTSNANPYVMAAATATFDLLADGGISHMAALGERMREGLRREIAAAGIPACVTGTGGSWALYMRPTPPRNYAEALTQDNARMVAYNQRLRALGIMEPLVPLADRRLCVSSTEDDVDETLAAAGRAMRAIV